MRAYFYFFRRKYRRAALRSAYTAYIASFARYGHFSKATPAATRDYIDLSRYFISLTASHQLSAGFAKEAAIAKISAMGDGHRPAHAPRRRAASTRRWWPTASPAFRPRQPATIKHDNDEEMAEIYFTDFTRWHIIADMTPAGIQARQGRASRRLISSFRCYILAAFRRHAFGQTLLARHRHIDAEAYERHISHGAGPAIIRLYFITTNVPADFGRISYTGMTGRRISAIGSLLLQPDYELRHYVTHYADARPARKHFIYAVYAGRCIYDTQ